MDIVISFLGKIGVCLLDPLKIHCGYLKHYDDNIGALKDQLETLENKKNDVIVAIEAAKRNSEKITDTVKHWITNVEKVMMEAIKFLEDDEEANKRCFRGWFPDLKTCYSLSKEAVNKKEMMKRLCEEGAGFDRTKVSLPAPPPGIESMDFELFQTTKLAMEKVMDALKEESTNFVGIHGMGGVGKTTLVKEIGRKCKEEKLFDNVAMVAVSQTPKVESIQEEIADFLKIKLEEKSLFARASRLCEQLKSEKMFLVILDDVWAKLDLATIGIPLGKDHKGCKVVITTRRRQVCTSMGRSGEATRIVRLDVLNKQESWDLFKKQVGDIIESHTLRIQAEKFVKECGHLPIALVTVGKAMRDKDLQEWKDSALELKKSRPTNVEDMDKNVFNCIKFSYDYLRDEEAKACFLLCCLFPENHNIEKERLVRYGMSLNIFKGINYIQEARSRAHLIINNLKDSSLLMASKIDGCIKMHDVVRDVAKTIAIDKYFVQDGGVLKRWPNDLSMDEYNGIGISLMRNEIQKFPDAWECPNLEILLMHDYNIKQEMPEEVFKGMKRLKVLDQYLNFNIEDRSLEPSLSHLKNLRTLIIESFDQTSIWGINALGELKMLEVVSFRGCIFGEPLDALWKLKNLRLLELKFCKNCSSLFNYTRTLAEDCNFPQLEELYVTEPMHCSVAKLNKYHPHLNVLTCCIVDISQIFENIVFPHLIHFAITVGSSYGDAIVGDYLENILQLSGGYSRRLDMALLSRIVILLRSVNILSLCHFHGFRNILPYLLVGSDSLACLKILEVRQCSELEFLINIKEESRTPRPTCFSCLEKLTLCELQSFRGLCGMVPNDMPYLFVSMRELYISYCPKMSNIDVPLNLLRRMRQLEVLQVNDCEAVEYLFDLKEEVEDVVEEEEEEEEGIFVNLKRMSLGDMNNLEQLWKGPIGLVSLRNLKTVEIRDCHKLRVLFHWSEAQRLEQLEKLTVTKCEELEEIVGRETGEEGVHKVLFPKLKYLYMNELPKLVGFYTGNLPGSQSTPMLKTVYMDEVAIAIDGKNLDTTIKELIASRDSRMVNALSRAKLQDGYVSYPWGRKMHEVLYVPNSSCFHSVLPNASDQVASRYNDQLEATLARANVWLNASQASGVPIVNMHIQTESMLTEISEETASSTVNAGSSSDLSIIVNASLYGFEDYHEVDIGVVRAVRLWYAPLGGEFAIEIKIKGDDSKLGFAISRTEEGFIYISTVMDGNENVPSSRSGLNILYKEAVSASKLLVLSRISNEKVLPWMVSSTGAIRCYDTVSLAQKLSLHRHAKVPVLLHVFLWDQTLSSIS